MYTTKIKNTKSKVKYYYNSYVFTTPNNGRDNGLVVWSGLYFIHCPFIACYI